MKTFANDTAAARTIASIAPENGLYFSPRGALMVRSFTPDLADQSQSMGTPLARQIGNLRPDPVKVGDLVADVVNQQFPGRRQPDTARQPLKDRGAQFFFHRQKPAVQRRRGDGQRLGRLADRPSPGNRIDKTQGVEMLHVRPRL